MIYLFIKKYATRLIIIVIGEEKVPKHHKIQDATPNTMIFADDQILLHVYEFWILTKQQIQIIYSDKMKFLRQFIHIYHIYIS